MFEDLLGSALGGAFGANGTHDPQMVQITWSAHLACPDPMLRNAAAAMNAYRPTPEQEAAWECHRITKEHVGALRVHLRDETILEVWMYLVWLFSLTATMGGWWRLHG